MSAHVASIHPHQHLATGTSALRSGRGYSQSGGGDLAILSAETYVDPGLSFLPSPPSVSSNDSNKKSSPRESNGPQTEGTSKKRLKRTSLESGDQEGDEEEKKRSRGRPRLDIKDETAADRRRTQIRLAQRAYRNRKENAIQTLETRVQELRDTIEEMSNAFMRLHDFAVNNGLVDQAPEFGRQLRSTTEKFLTLARMSSEENSKLDDGEGNSPKQTSDTEPSAPNNKPNPKKQQQPQQPPVITPPPDTSSMSSLLESKGNQVYGGFIVTHEPLSDVDVHIDDLLTPTTTSADFTLPTSTTSMPGATNLNDYEIITQPTLDNASFPLDFSFDLSTNLDMTNPLDNLSNTGTPAGGYFNTYSGTLFPTLSIPTSYASQEATFGRRLQRTGIERALVLITMPNPPMKRFNRVFGFALMLESKEAIYKRLMRGIQKSAAESLNNWSFPFYNLGGAGTHHPQSQTGNTGDRMMGNAGTIDLMKPVMSGGYNMGPFDTTVGRVRDRYLDGDMRVNPGFVANGNSYGGEYFDCDEIEGYLHERGVVIPPAADFINAEVDAASFENGEGESGPGLVINSLRSPLGTSLSGAGSTAVPSPRAGNGNGDGTGSSSWGNTGTSGMAAATGTKKMVTVDVNLLVYELTERSVCLGRTPGIKQEDINVAFWKASQVLG